MINCTKILFHSLNFKSTQNQTVPTVTFTLDDISSPLANEAYEGKETPVNLTVNENSDATGRLLRLVGNFDSSGTEDFGLNYDEDISSKGSINQGKTQFLNRFTNTFRSSRSLKKQRRSVNIQRKSILRQTTTSIKIERKSVLKQTRRSVFNRRKRSNNNQHKRTSKLSIIERKPTSNAKEKQNNNKTGIKLTNIYSKNSLQSKA